MGAPINASPTDLARFAGKCRPVGDCLILCVYVDHLEPVTPAENLRRSNEAPATINAQKTHCPKNHAYDEANTHVRPNGQRECRACGREEARRYLAANRDAHNARRRARRRSAA